MTQDGQRHGGPLRINSMSPGFLSHGRWRAILAVLSVVVGAGLLAGLPWSGADPTGAPTVEDEVPVTATDQIRQPANNSPVVVADPTDDRLLALASRLDAPDFGCALHLSGDSGRSWMPVSPVTALPQGADKCYAPEAAFDPKGTLYFLFVGLQGQGNEPMGAFLVTSADEGRTFTPPRQVLGPLNFGVRMAIDPLQGDRGRIHLVWLHANADPHLGGFPTGPNPVMAAHSDDGGATFSESVQISDPTRARVVAPALALGPDHAVHVAYYDLQDDARDYQGLEGPVWEGGWSVVVATSLDGGGRFTPGSVVDEEIAPPERPMLIFTMAPPALAAGSDRVCAAWTDARHGDPDVLARCSPSQGASWEPLRRVNDDPVGNGVRQYMPRLSIAPGGRLDAVFLDRRYDPNNANNDVSYTYSEDGGRSFVAPHRLTTRSWSPRIGPQYVGPAAEGQFEIGGRLALMSRSSGAIAAWPDTRWAGVPRPGRTAQDVFAVQVRLPSPDRPAWAGGLGGVLLAAGLVCLAGLTFGRRRGRALRPQPDPGPSVDPPPPPGLASPSEAGAATSRPRLVIGLVLVAALGTVGVVQLAKSRDRSKPAAHLVPQVVDVTMTEYRFDYQPPARGGRTVFRVRNEGRENHAFDLTPLPADFPPIDAQLRGTERRGVDSFVELGVSRPGTAGNFAVDLVVAQRYALLCFLRNPADEVHALLGMNSEFRTG